MINNNKFFLFLIAIVLLIISFFIHICYGASTIGFYDVIEVLLNKEVTDKTTIIIKSIRLPRATGALVVGATLGASGTLIKAVMRNPLADTGLLGIQSGASVVAIFIMLVNPALYKFLPIGAFLGGLITYVILMSLAFKNNKINPLRLVLSGIAVNAFLGSIIGLMTIFYSDRLESALSWLNGSFVGINNDNAKLLVLYGVIAIFISLLLIPKCNLLMLDDNTVQNLGENVNLTRFIVATCAVLLSSISVSVVGIVGFVGLVIPHIGKILIGQNHKFLLPFSIILGSTFTLLADGLQKIIFSPMEIPVGIIISFIGAPFFLYLLRKEFC